MGTCCSIDSSAVRNRVFEKEGEDPDEADITSRPEQEEDIKIKDTKPTEAAASSNDTSKAAHETIPFPKNGIKLSYLLNDFVVECGGREALEGLTTTEVCDNFVKPATKDYELSYCDMILEKAKKPDTFTLDGVVKRATVFISHAWKYKFLDVLSALEDHFKDEPDKIVWFDLVSNNQHKGPELPYEWWATTFKDAIEQLGHTVMVMAPWNDPIPYQRAWCIFEAYCTSVTDAKFEIAMSKNEHRAFIDECKHNPTTTINKMLSIVNAEKSEAWNPLDKERIHSVIKEEVGFAKINSMVFEQLRDWVLVVALAALTEVKVDTEDEADLMYLVGALYSDQGQYDEAEPLYKECLAKSETKLGSNHPDTLQSMNNLAALYRNQGKYDEAESLFKECRAKYTTILGSDHPDTLQSMNNLAALYYNQGKYDEAERLYKECLAKREMILGPDHPDTLKSMNNLAALYYNQCRYNEAEPLLKECLTKRKTILGSDHPDTFQPLNNLAALYKNQGRYDEAEPLYKECLAKCETILGPDHPHTLGSMNNLALLYRNQGKYDEAESLFKECRAKYTTILGSDHPHTLASMNNLAALYESQGRYDEAEPLYKDCLAKRETILGSDHIDTLNTMNGLARLYLSLGKYDEAEPLYKECLARLESVLGFQHPSTVAVRGSLEYMQSLMS
ncbi:TPR-like protein [Chaetoceros tenuissimus]|uniref:TPR-like protein n=1 Tax=Chaetoceros tenuissimus TaxID=426638 RepID=A0AAD3D2C6_9STRA|nr:TPR-like protein [Chaetoceros tenuissimus]